MAKFESHSNKEIGKALTALSPVATWALNAEASQKEWTAGAREWFFIDEATGANAKVWYEGRGRKAVAEFI